MIFLFSWDKATRSCHALDAEILQKDPGRLRSPGQVTWIDLDAPTLEEEALVLKSFFKVHPLTEEDITRPRRIPDSPPHFPKVEEFADYLFVIVNPLDGRDTVSQLSAILTSQLLITHHYHPLDSVREVRSFLGRHETSAERGPDYLFHLLLDAVVDQYVPVIDAFDEELDEVELQVIAKPTPALMRRLFVLKREIIKLRKTLIYEREVLARMARGEFSLIDEREKAYYRNVYDHVIRFNELLDTSREMVTDLVQTHLSATSNKLNEIMKVLTMISTVVLPMTLVAGIYGMNFPDIPEMKWPWGYWWALGVMGLTGMVSFAYFKWKNWL